MTDKAVLERIEKLEATNQRQKWHIKSLAAAAVALGAALFLTGANETAEVDTLRVRQLLLENERGQVMGKWIVNTDGSVLQKFYDQDGTERLLVGLLRNGIVRQRMFAENGNPTFSVSSYPDNDQYDGYVGWVMYNMKQENAELLSAGYTVDENDEIAPLIKMKSPRTGKQIYALGINGETDAFQMFSSTENSANFQAGIINGYPYYSLIDENLHTRIHAAVNKGIALSDMRDVDGRIRWSNAVGNVLGIREAFNKEGDRLLGQGVDGDGLLYNYAKKTPDQELGNLINNIGNAATLFQALSGDN